MKEAVAVDIVKSARYLVYDMSDLLVREGVIVELAHLHHSVQVHVQQLEHHVERVFVANDFEASDDIGMLEADHGFDFSVSHGSFPRRELPLESLQSIYRFGLFIGYLVNDTEASLPQRL